MQALSPKSKRKCKSMIVRGQCELPLDQIQMTHHLLVLLCVSNPSTCRQSQGSDQQQSGQGAWNTGSLGGRTPARHEQQAYYAPAVDPTSYEADSQTRYPTLPRGYDATPQRKHTNHHNLFVAYRLIFALQNRPVKAMKLEREGLRIFQANGLDLPRMQLLLLPRRSQALRLVILIPVSCNLARMTGLSLI